MATKIAPASSVETAQQVEATRVSEQVSKPEPAAERLVSLDAFRGFTMFWIIGGASIIRGLGAFGGNPVIASLVYQMDHTPWRGLRYYDVIWPCFMLMVGVSVAFSYRSQLRSKTERALALHAVKRAVVLFLLGSLRASVSSGSATLIELSSALQPIAVAYLVAFLLARRSMRLQASVCAAILLGYGLLLHFVPAPGIQSGTYEPNENLVTWVDLAVLGRAHPEGWGTVLSTIPTISTTLLGLMLGRLLLSERALTSKMSIIAVVGASAVVVGLSLDPVVPVIMKLWTASYGILSAGWACLLFLFFYWIIDGRGYRRWSFVFVVIGMNAIAAYMAGTLVSFSRILGPFTNDLVRELGPLGPSFRSLAVFALEWLILYWMYRRKIFLKA